MEAGVPIAPATPSGRKRKRTCPTSTPVAEQVQPGSGGRQKSTSDPSTTQENFPFPRIVKFMNKIVQGNFPFPHRRPDDTAPIGSSTRHCDAALEQRQRPRGMGDHEARGDDFEKKAEQKLSGWGLFCNKYKDAADLLEKAGNFFKIAKNWSRAAGVYKKSADCHLQGDGKDQAASAYVEAANCYKRFSPLDAANALDDAVNLFLEMGKLTMAARYSKDISEIYQQEQDLEKAAVYLNRAADLFDSDGQSSWANSMTEKIAEIYAQLEKYQEATELFEEIARSSFKYHVRGILLNAGICQICRGDTVAINKSLVRYQNIDPTFSRTREYKLLVYLAASMDEADIARFTDALKEFGSMTQLDPWKTTLLVKAMNNKLKQKEDENDL